MAFLTFVGQAAPGMLALAGDGELHHGSLSLLGGRTWHIWQAASVPFHAMFAASLLLNG